mgnify:CR=1 FL=1
MPCGCYGNSYRLLKEGKVIAIKVVSVPCVCYGYSYASWYFTGVTIIWSQCLVFAMVIPTHRKGALANEVSVSVPCVCYGYSYIL